MTLIDSHCHLGSPAYADDLEEVIRRAREAGVTEIVTIGSGYGLGGNDRAIAIARDHEGIHAVVGVHPHEADQVGPGDLERLAALAEAPEVVAWGEMGLDFYRDHSKRENQRRVFAEQIRIARRLDLPIVIHSRAAEEETLAILDQEGAFEGRVLIHCFTHDEAFARAVLDRGGWLSVPGVVTYRNAGAMRAAVPLIPNESLLLETDGPFLSPAPHRGRRNEPAYLVHTAEEVARLKGLSPRDVARASARATRTFFGLIADEAPEGAVAYRIRDSLYLNPTNRCTLACTFCHKHRDWTVAGYHLHLRGYQPSADDLLIAASVASRGESATRAQLEAARGEPLADLGHLDEVVFVGYGEPTRRLEVILDAARRLRTDMGARSLRLDTDGLASLRQGRDVIPDVAAAFDAVTVSINAPDGETYASLCPSRFGARAHEAAVAFLRGCVEARIPWVQGTVVGVPGLDIEACRDLVESTGARFRERVYHVVG